MKIVKIEWSAMQICEIVFGINGTIFTILGVVFGIFIDEIAASPNSRGDVYIIPWVFGSVGIVFLFVFFILLIITIKQKKKRKQLIENGRYLDACVAEIKQNYFIQINGRNPYYVICEGINPYTGETLTFKSSYVMENPSHLLGQYLRVFIDYEKPKNYYVEINPNR